MVLISSQFRRASRLFYGFAYTFAAIILASSAALGVGTSTLLMRRWGSPCSPSEWVLHLGANLVLCSIAGVLCLWCARRLARPTAYFKMTEEGLEFSVCPGINCARVLPWEDVTGIREISPAEETRGLRALNLTNGLIFGDYACFVVERSQPMRELFCSTRLARVIYLIDRKLMSRCLPAKLRGKVELHSIATGGVPCSVIVDAVNALIRDPDLRDRFCTPSGQFTIQPQEQKETIFQFVSLAGPPTEADSEHARL